MRSHSRQVENAVGEEDERWEMAARVVDGDDGIRGGRDWERVVAAASRGPVPDVKVRT